MKLIPDVYGGHESCPDPNALLFLYRVSYQLLASIFRLIEEYFNQSCTMNLQEFELAVRQSFVATLTPTSGTKSSATYSRTKGVKEACLFIEGAGRKAYLRYASSYINYSNGPCTYAK